MEESSRRGYPWLFIKIGATTALLLILLIYVDWRLMAESISQVRCGYLLAALTSFFSIALLEVMRLRTVLERFSLAWSRVWRLHIVGTFFGNFLPGQVGADLYKILSLKPADGGIIAPTVLIFTLRFIGLLVLLTAAVLSAVFAWEGIYEKLNQEGIWIDWESGIGINLLLGLSFTAIVVLGIVAWSYFREQFAQWWGRIWKQIREVLSVLNGMLVATLIVLTCVILVARVLVLYFLCLAVGIYLSTVDAVLIVSFATLLTLIPITIAGIGLREGTIVVLLVLSGAVYEDAVLVALLGRAFLLLISVSGGLWLLCDMFTSKRGPDD